MKIPVFDLSRAAARIRPELDERWRRLVDQTAFVGGREVEEFETAFARYLGTAGCVGVGNGTDALVLALRALDLRPGDEVLVPAFSFFATASCVVLAGGRPVFTDVEPATLNLDLRSAAGRIGVRTVGLIGVHLYGRPFDVDGALRLCRDHGLWLLEDAAQAHGARWRGERVGGFGRLATWSFYPSKNLGCFGDGGALTSNDRELLERVRRLGNHGQTARYHHVEVGTNSRLDGLQAAVLNCRLPRLDPDNERRREIARRYQRLRGVGDLRLLEDRAEAEPVYHQMTVLSARREALREHLGSRGIGTALHYPEALHRQPAMSEAAGGDGGLATAERAAREALCLPMFPELEDREVDAVCEAVEEFFRR